MLVSVLFLIIGLLLAAFGYWHSNESDKINLSEGRRDGLLIMILGLIVTAGSIWGIVVNVKELFN